MQGQVLIAHNDSFDFSVLRKTLDAYNLSYPTLSYACSYIFCKNLRTGLPAYDLKTLCRTNKIDFHHHRAAADSRAAAELSLQAFEHEKVTSFDDFPERLNTSLGNLFDGGYTPSRSYSSNF